jgi:hypothetical protein
MAFRVIHLIPIVLVVQLGVIGVYIMTSRQSETRPTATVRTVASNRTDLRLPTNVTSEPEVFQQIDDKPAWVHSAFFDHVAAQNGKPMVRVFGLARKDYFKKAYCTLTADGKNQTTTSALVSLPESHNTNHQPVYLECYHSGKIWPTHVSVSFQTNQTSANRLPVIYPGPRVRNFTVCYSVLHSTFKMATQLIESIEMNRILGAEHFMIYTNSVSLEVDQILRRYQEDGLVTVFQWPLPTNDTHYYAQVLALNNCFYRNRNTSRFVVVVDTDELIVPRNHLTWMSFIDAVSPYEVDVSQFRNSSKPANKGNKLTGCFMVRSSYFPPTPFPNWDSLSLPFDEEEKKNIIKHKILTLSQLTRLDHIFPYYDRCKYIARPEHVYNSGIHYVMGFVGTNACLRVHENTALVHHYRSKPTVHRRINDTIMVKFKQSLYPRVMEQIRRFPNIFM